MKKHILFFLIVLISITGYFFLHLNDNSLSFTIKEKNSKLTVNNQDVIPPFDIKIKDYYLSNLTTLKPNIIQFGSQKKEFSLQNINRFDIIHIKIDNQTYNLHLYPGKMPEVIPSLSNKAMDNYLLISPFDGRCSKGSYMYISNKKGQLKHYQKAPENKCFSDFKQTTLPNGEILYSVMQQEKEMPPFSYWFGSLLIFDNQFNLINKLKLKPTDKHPELDVENHDSLILDKNHYILTAYQKKEIIHPQTDEVIFIADTVIQEIKDGKVLFDWMGTDHPELYQLFKYPDPNLDKTVQDYLHFNSVIIDPKDNNLIVSFASIGTVVKIDRRSGKIIWKLGGEKDDFNINKEHLFYGQHSLSITKEGYLMLFDNQSYDFAKRVLSDPSQIKPTSRILKFKLDEQNKKILDVQEINLDVKTNTLGSVYQTKDLSLLVSTGQNKRILEIGTDNQILFELLLSLPTYRVYQIDKLK